MSRSVDETRREFLLRLAKGAAFVPPALMTLDVSRVFGQKGGAGGGAGATGSGGQTATGGAATGVSPPGGALRSFQMETQQSGEPWDPGESSGSPPWSKPPPTQAGR